MSSPVVHLTLPATSANVGPGFDAVGLALSLALEVEASPADVFSIAASGRDIRLVEQLDRNLILTTYADVLQEQGRPVQPLRLVVRNGIPLGMGCGSSAAALCAGVSLADAFGDFGWSTEQVLDEAARREGHPDNVAACVQGGFTISRTLPKTGRTDRAQGTVTATFGGEELRWRLLLALPTASLATESARALLPPSYSRADAVESVQMTALLVSAFALDRPELLRAATADRLHQPFREPACPLFAALKPLALHPHVFSVTLSGAGPSVLLVVDEQFEPEAVERAAGPLLAELLPVGIAGGMVRRALPTNAVT